MFHRPEPVLRGSSEGGVSSKLEDDETAARELAAWAQPQGIKVEFELRREGGVDVIYVFPAVR